MLLNHPHYLTVTELDGERSVDWTHRDDCPDAEHCDIARRTHRIRREELFALADGRPVGRYRLGCFGFHGLVLVDEDGALLPDAVNRNRKADMNLNREPAAIAKAAAEEVRALNHRTLDVDAFEQPGDVYRTISALAQLVQGLPQAIEQTWKQLRAMEQAGSIRMDDLSDIDASMEEARLALSEARRLIATGGGYLNQAAKPMSHMGGQW
ncbi:hypothetical protein OHQ89_12120 [Streptomyces canus]|uniref:hypothetical protein n=1 Tax=Streptomyces canus TaxID=58343 RepID=UPI0030DF8BFD